MIPVQRYENLYSLVTDADTIFALPYCKAAVLCGIALRVTKW